MCPLRWMLLFGLVVAAGCSGGKSDPPPRPRTPTAEDQLVGRWQTTLATPGGVVEVITFSRLGPSGEGDMTQHRYHDGKVLSSRAGRYKWGYNPLLPQRDRVQIRMKLDGADGREQTVVLRSVSDTTLVFASLYVEQTIEYRRTR